jgi:hypothetical protein
MERPPLVKNAHRLHDRLMTTPAMPPFARAPQLPAALSGVVTALCVLGADAAAMAVWWWGEQGTGSPARTWLLGVVTAAFVATVLALMVRHPVARRAAVGALAVAVVLDAVVIGYELSGLR